jgi:hypothetical protein
MNGFSLQMSSLENQIIYVFNKFTKSFIREIKKDDDEIRNILKKNYICFDKTTDVYLKDFIKAVDTEEIETLFLSGTVKENEIVNSIEVLNELTVSQLNNDNKFYYLYVFYLLARLYKDSISTEDVSERSGYKAILVSILKLLNGGYDSDEILDEIYDDNYKMLMKQVALHQTEQPLDEGPSAEDPFNMDMVNNTKIGKLAREISSQIDVSSINTENMAGAGINDLFSGDNNAMSSIIQQVSSVMSDKMKNGDIDQEELMKEALSMMGNMNNSDMMESMMGMMKNVPK